MNELAPGLWHWTVRHPHIGSEVSSYYLESERVLIDPMLPPEGPEWFEPHGAPEHVLLSNRHHDRDAWKLREAFGCQVHCIRNGLTSSRAEALRRAYRGLLESELEFDLLLLAHGNPVAPGGREALESFLAEG